MERETGFEPATSTLARSHSTTELFPLVPGRERFHGTTRVPLHQAVEPRRAYCGPSALNAFRISATSGGRPSRRP